MIDALIYETDWGIEVKLLNLKIELKLGKFYTAKISLMVHHMTDPFE